VAALSAAGALLRCVYMCVRVRVCIYVRELMCM